MDIQVQSIVFNPKLKGEILVIQGNTAWEDVELNNKFVVTNVESNKLEVAPLHNPNIRISIRDEDIEMLKITHVPVPFDPNYK